MQDNVGVDHEPVAVPRGELGVPGVSLLGKNGAESRELGAKMTFGKATGDVITDIPLAED